RKLQSFQLSLFTSPSEAPNSCSSCSFDRLFGNLLQYLLFCFLLYSFTLSVVTNVAFFSRLLLLTLGIFIRLHYRVATRPLCTPPGSTHPRPHLPSTSLPHCRAVSLTDQSIVPGVEN